MVGLGAILPDAMDVAVFWNNLLHKRYSIVEVPGYVDKNGVNIPQAFAMFNDAYLFHSIEQNAFFYKSMVTPDERASSCTDCLECVEKCPQKLPIPERMERLAAIAEALRA